MLSQLKWPQCRCTVHHTNKCENCRSKSNDRMLWFEMRRTIQVQNSDSGKSHTRSNCLQNPMKSTFCVVWVMLWPYILRIYWHYRFSHQQLILLEKQNYGKFISFACTAFEQIALTYSHGTKPYVPSKGSISTLPTYIWHVTDHRCNERMIQCIEINLNCIPCTVWRLFSQFRFLHRRKKKKKKNLFNILALKNNKI